MGEENTTISITYETLFELLRREKNREEIQKLQKTFYEDVNSYLGDKKTLLESGNLSPGEREKTQKQIENTKKMIRELFERREKKIIILALNKVRTASSITDTTSFLDPEKYFFHKMVEFFSDYRAEVLDGALNGQPGTLQKTPLQPVERKEAPKKAQETSLAKKTVRFTAPVPKFIGKELEVYGPYIASDKATLPQDIAEVLIRKGRAVEVQAE